MSGWYVRRGEKVIGPTEVDKLKESVAAGKLLPTDQLAKDTTGPWTEAGKTKLFAQKQMPKPQPTAIVPQAEQIVVVTPERVAEATRKSPARALWVAGSLVALSVVSLAGFLLLPTGNPEPVAAESSALEPMTASSAVDEPTDREPKVSETANQQPVPFEYKILNEDWHDDFQVRAVTIEAQVADDVAPTVTKADLESLAPSFMEKYGGAPYRVLFYTETPLVNAWGVINYTPQSPLGKDVDCQIIDFAFEMGPWYFPDKIDRNSDWHKRVWLTLPMANKIVNGATQYHWEVTSRSANYVYFDSKERPFGAMKDDMRLSPQTWEICTYDRDVPRFVRLVESSLNHLDYELSQNVVGKLNSVIGSQEFLSGDKMFWTWMLGQRELTYTHRDNSDTITIMQTDPE